MIEHDCSACGYPIESPEDMAGEEINCPSCGEVIIVPYEENDERDDEIEDNQTSLLDFAEDVYKYKTHGETYHRRRGWLKNLVAILIGIIVGLFLRVIIAIPITLIFATEEGLPLDITFILEAFTAFVAGGMAGSLVPRLGWLIGALTQLLKMIVTLVLIGLWVFFVVTEKEVDFSLDFLRMPTIRLMIVAILIAGIAGTVGERYRKNIWVFLSIVFGFIGYIFGFICYAVAGLCYLYCLYRGGKALFEDGAILKAMLFVFVIGPVVSGLFWAIFMGLFMLGAFLYEKIYNWYAPDIGLHKREVF